MNPRNWIYGLGLFLLVVGLPVVSYLMIIYRQLGRVTTGRVHEHLDIFEAELEPRMRMERRKAARSFRLLAHLWLAILVMVTTQLLLSGESGNWEVFAELIVIIGLEVVLAMHFLPDIFLYRTTGRWLVPLLPALRACLWLVLPVRVFLDVGESLARISEEEPGGAADERADNEGIEALVEAAEEEGIIERGQAELIEQVVEFSDKRVREVMTARPDIVAIAAGTSLAELKSRFVETRFSRLPVYETALDDTFGVVFAQDLLRVPEQDLEKRRTRELTHAAMLVPETKSGSELLKEMRQKNQQMAVVIDEHGSVAGIVTVEDLVEEIVGEAGEGLQPRGDVVRELDGSYIVRGSLGISDLEGLLNIHLGGDTEETATTIAGLLSHRLSRVPAPGDRIEMQGYRFEVLEANQRKVLRVRIRRQAEAGAAEASRA
ncbi:MAG: hemolysin family protein [Acidobacteriia bacterium]|nr:hemolysin family protein [Terriglobia bacterium]